MKGKLRILSFILIGVMFCNIEVANAVQKSATAYLVPAPASGSLFYSIPKCVTNEKGEEVCNGYEDYHDNQFEVVMDGKTLEGFCLDAGYGATTRENGGFSLTCTSIESYRTAKAIKYVLEKAPNHLIKQLALRFIAYDRGFARAPQDHGKYISQYWDGRYPDLGLGLIGDPAAEA